MNYFRLVILLCFFHQSLWAQIGMGQWREHLPYRQVISLADDGHDRLYAATPYALFYFRKSDYSINKMNSTNLLSDIGVSTIAFDPATEYLVVGYENGNIDLIKNDMVSNLPDIKRKAIMGSKKINHILFIRGKAWLATDFGIVVLDLKKKEVYDTYYIGDQATAVHVNQLASDGDSIYAATLHGLYYAGLHQDDLANYQNWKHDNQLPNADQEYHYLSFWKNRLLAAYHSPTYGNDKLYLKDSSGWVPFKPWLSGPFTVVKGYGDTLIIGKDYGFQYYFAHESDSFNIFNYNQGSNDRLPQPLDIIKDGDNALWIGDKTRGLVYNERDWIFKLIIPEGPYATATYDMDIQQSKLWVTSGGRQPTGANLYTKKGLYSFIDEHWLSYNAGNTEALDSISDVTAVAINPQNPEEVWIGSWGYGLLHFKGGKLTEILNQTNSPLPESTIRQGFVGVSALEYDREGNLWVLCSSSPDGLLKRMADGNWQSFNLSPYINEDLTGNLAIDEMDQKWMIIPRRGLLVYFDNFTPDNPWDDQKTFITAEPGKGHLPDNMVYSLAVDLDGEMWVGTSKGVAVFYSPELVFSGQEYDAQQIYVEQEGISQYLLESEEVTAIAIDGGNRKWFGTANAGVFLMSEDATEQIHHFNTDNSPLLSNNIYSIVIDHRTGEVFFATEKGIISYRSDATTGVSNADSVLVYPNPIRPEYHGPVSITGLMTNARVRITDIASNVVYEATAHGGTLVWNGKNYQGERVASGVYLVFATNDDGTEKKVARLLFIH